VGCSVKVNRHGYLAFRLYWDGSDWLEGTKLKDTPDNRAKVEDRARVIDQEMAEGVFSYLQWFQEGNQAWRFRKELKSENGKPITLKAFFRVWGAGQTGGGETKPVEKQVKVVSPKWAVNRASYIDCHVLPSLGPTRPDELTSTSLVRLQQQLLKKGLGRSTIDRITHSALRGMLRDMKMEGYAVPDLLSLYDPNYITRLSSDDEGGAIDPYTEGERDQIIEGFRLHAPDFYHFVFFRFWTGTRPSEAIALRVEDVDLGQKLFRVRKSRVMGKDGAPKKKRSKRNPAIHDNLATLLKEYLVAHPKGGSDFLFTTPNGAPIDENNFYSRHWLPMLERLKIRERPFYNTRHTYITYMLAIGCRAAWVSKQTGTSLKMIEEHYCGVTVLAKEVDQLIAQHTANRNPAGTPSPSVPREVEDNLRKVAPIQGVRQRAGDRGRTGDVQLGKLAFYR